VIGARRDWDELGDPHGCSKSLRSTSTGVSRSNTSQTTVAESESIRVIVPNFPANGPLMIRAWSPSWSDVGIAASMTKWGAPVRPESDSSIGHSSRSIVEWRSSMQRK
jgi:hypothetical protein